MMFTRSAISTCLLLAGLVNSATACTDTVYVGTAYGQLAISKNGGNTWSTVLNITGGQFTTVSANGDHIYAGAAYGLAVSHDGGASWSIKDLQTTSNCDRTVVSVFVDTEKRVYALIGQFFGCGRVSVSSDNGESWPTSFKLPNPPFASWPWNIYVDGTRIYVASDVSGLGYTDDLGTTWTLKNQASGLGSDWVLSVIGKGQTIYAGLNLNRGALSASLDDGQTWKTVDTTPTGIANSANSMYLQDDTLYVATLGGGLSWSSDFTTWTRKTTADGLGSDTSYSIIGSGNNLYLGTDNGLSISRDKGQTWFTKTTKDGLPSNNIHSVFAQCV